jgi:hypothetical protein
MDKQPGERPAPDTDAVRKALEQRDEEIEHAEQADDEEDDEEE